MLTSKITSIHQDYFIVENYQELVAGLIGPPGPPGIGVPGKQGPAGRVGEMGKYFKGFIFEQFVI